MALKMPSPWDRNGTYYFRLRVPEELRPLVGKKLVVKSLDTKDPREAKLRFATMLVTVKREWDRLAAAGEIVPPKERERLKPKQIQGIAGEFYRWMVSKHDDDPGKAEKWLEEAEKDRRYIVPPKTKGLPWVTGGPGRYMPLVQQFLEERGILVPESELFDISAAAAWAGMRAKERLARIAARDYSADPAEAHYPKWEEVKPTLTFKSEMVTLADHFEGFGASRAPKSRKKYRSCLQDLERFLQNPNLASATPDDIQRWVEDLASRMVVEDGKKVRKIGDKNIADGYLAAARSFYSWAVRRRKMPANPAEKIRHDVPKKQTLRPPYFSDKEATLILSEARREPSGKESPQFAAAKRWVPWICAYTGARVNEITQLRGQDVRRHVSPAQEEVWTIKITPEAGTVKNGKAREVPLHPHLIEQGFAKFAKGAGDGQLFFDPERQRVASDENPTATKVGAKIAEWVRKMGIPDGVAPNHGWRHRFNHVCRKHHMNPEIRDAIKGHEPRTEGEEYGGDIEWDMMWPLIKGLPRYDAQPATGPRPGTKAYKEAFEAKRREEMDQEREAAEGNKEPIAAE